MAKGLVHNVNVMIYDMQTKGCWVYSKFSFLVGRAQTMACSAINPILPNYLPLSP